MQDPTRIATILFLVVGPLVTIAFAINMTWNWLVDWQDIVLLATLYTLTAFGVTIGFHRYLTHGSFKTNRVIKYILVILGTMSWQGGPIGWASNHRQHHAYADEEGDLHSPHLSRNLLRGFFHAQMGWLLGNNRSDPHRWARDLIKDPDIVFINRTAVLWCGLSLLVPFLIGGWSGLLWGGFVRILLAHHVTWSVNSVCHIFGSRPFNTNDLSTNHWLVGLLAFGEGGHNTHHASPRSARHGLYWWHFDSSWVVIGILERLRLAYNVYALHPEDLKVALRDRAAGIKVIFRHELRNSKAASTAR